eukprot:TRINITY_DN1783_c1_g1_i3.p1 TRINITY_DN1783_c1_g1~~TRINITY_DN1783_c1_g1_i3.p1  ORF type:complete len:118 (+),score=17.72 TRINITY_DN1783_c1_g1_i3:200-553(+)
MGGCISRRRATCAVCSSCEYVGPLPVTRELCTPPPPLSLSLYFAAYRRLSSIGGSDRRIRKITPAGVVTTLAGDGTSATTDGNGVAAQLTNPEDVVVHPDGGLYFTSACYLRRVQLV